MRATDNPRLQHPEQGLTASAAAIELDLEHMVLTATGDHHEELHVLTDTPTIELAPLATRMITVRVRAEHTHHRESKKIRFVLESRDEGARPFTLREKSRFLYP